MEARELIKNIKKEFIYEMYLDIVDDPKMYGQLTRYKMYDEIVEHYADLSREEFLSYFGKSELEILKSILADEFKFKLYQLEFYEVLSKKGFIFETGWNQYEIPKELSKILKKNIGKKLPNKVVLRMDVEEFILGFLRVHGVFPAKLIAMFVDENMDDVTMFGVYDILTGSNNLRHYYSIIEVIEDDELLAYNQYKDSYFSNFRVITEGQVRDFHNIHYRTKEEYLAMARYGYNTCNSVVKKFFDKLEDESDNIQIRCFYDFLIILPHFNISFLKSPFLISQIQECVGEDLELSHVLELQNNMISATLVGNTQNEYNALEGVKQREKNRVFSYDEANNFYDVYMALLEYTNDVYEIRDDIRSILNQEYDSLDGLIDIRNYVFRHKHIIDDFISENPFCFSDEYLQIVDDFKLGFIGEFIICVVHMTYTLLMDRKKNVYKVRGLNNDLRSVLVEEPHWAKVVLVPYRGKIIYDGIVTGLDIDVNDNDMRLVHEALKDEESYITTFNRMIS